MVFGNSGARSCILINAEESNPCGKNAAGADQTPTAKQTSATAIHLSQKSLSTPDLLWYSDMNPSLFTPNGFVKDFPQPRPAMHEGQCCNPQPKFNSAQTPSSQHNCWIQSRAKSYAPFRSIRPGKVHTRSLFWAIISQISKYILTCWAESDIKLAGAIDMNRREFILASAAAGLSCRQPTGPTRSRIDRVALVARHSPVLTTADTRSPLQVGNGHFAFTADVTGLQTFAEEYLIGMPLGTLSDWAWHSFPNPENYKLSDIMRPYDWHGREVPYADGWAGSGSSARLDRIKKTVGWLRQNPQRIDLGRIGFVLRKASGENASLSDIADIDQRLDLLNGRIESRFEFEHKPVQVTTLCHPQHSLLAVRVKSPLISSRHLSISIAFPYPSGTWRNEDDWKSTGQYRTKITQSQNNAIFECTLDAARYWVQTSWSGKASWRKVAPHHFHLFAPHQNEIDLIFSFAPEQPASRLPGFRQVQKDAERFWQEFWNSGGAIDLSGSTHLRAGELERRIVLSQYLTAVNCSGSLPPQETGLVTDSWYGKFHLEMHWWHAAHFALWNRAPLLEKSLPWYSRILSQAKHTARLQGYRGARWPKMVGPDGRESPSSVGAYIIWQQPHPIYYAELLYRTHPDHVTLERFREIVHETAEFMASFAWWDSKSGRYILGPPVVPAQESYANIRTRVINPAFELAYWQWGLSIAQKWRERLGQSRHPEWDRVIAGISRPLVRDGLYAAIGVPPYTLRTDHPSVLYALGFVPSTPLIHQGTMRRTLGSVLRRWNWDSTWGWDYPAIAMTAARLGKTEKAIEALMMEVPKNHYLPNGHCYQRPNLPLYLPANGGLLYATAMMAAGWKGCPNRPAPGFPANGSWKVRHERLLPAL
jgi:hypothetical protein